MSEPTPEVRTEIRDRAFWIVIDRPAARNALSADVARGIAAGLVEAQRHEELRAVVLTGAGNKAFCAGGDLKAGSGPFTFDAARPQNAVIDLFLEFERSPLPTIARVNGHALAGGLGLVCACDLAIGVEGATFGVPETGIGLFPMMILPYLQQAMPRRKLLEWCITGERWTAADALEVGILNYVTAPGALDEKLDWLLARIVDKSPTAIRLGKRGLRAIRDMSLQEAFEYTQLALPMMATTEDAKEGFAAFRDRRKPEWTGR